MGGKFIWALVTSLACTISLLSGYGMGIRQGKSTGLSPMDCFFLMIPCDSSSWKSSTATQSKPTGSSNSSTCPSFDTSSQGLPGFQSESVRSSSGMIVLSPSQFRFLFETPCSMLSQESLRSKSSIEIEEALWAF